MSKRRRDSEGKTKKLCWIDETEECKIDYPYEGYLSVELCQMCQKAKFLHARRKQIEQELKPT